ncbi:MAG: sigma-70 family RNA polymerase sigma factor [Chloroflexota bacterium]
MGLVSKALQGDRSAFGELVCHYHPGVVNVVYRMCGDVQLAEDAAQEAFLRAWLHLASYRPQASLRNWLYRIAINAVLDVLRKDRNMPGDLESVPVADRHPGPEEQFYKREQARRVQLAVSSLSESNRAVLVLREYGDLSYQEIATALEIPIGTVMSRLNYARNYLRGLLADLVNDHD